MNNINRSTETLFKFEKVDRYGNVLQTVGPFHNLMLDQGLDAMFNTKMSALTEYIHIGSGTSTPQKSDTSLGNEVAVTNKKESNTRSGNLYMTEDSYRYRISTFQFDEGEVVASGDVDIAEVGLGPIDFIINRQLLPEFINIAHDQGLRIEAETRMYYHPSLPGIPIRGSFQFNGETINYSNYFYDAGYEWFDPDYQRMIFGYSFPELSNSSSFSAGGSAPNSETYSEYIPGTFYIDGTFVWDPGSFVGDVEKIGVSGYGSSWHSFIYLDTPITVTDLEELTLAMRFTWARYEPSNLEWSPIHLDSNVARLNFDYGSNHDGYSTNYALVGSPTLSGDYVYFDGIDDGIIIRHQDETVKYRDRQTFHIKFRAHDKAKGRYQVIYKEAEGAGHPGWAWTISPSGDLEFLADKDPVVSLTIPSSAWNEGEIYNWYWTTWTNTLELYDDFLNLVKSVTVDETPRFFWDDWGEEETSAGYSYGYSLAGSDGYYFEGDIFFIRGYTYTTQHDKGGDA